MKQSLQLASAAMFGCAFLGASLLNACDPQASTEYRGDPLFTLKIGVELSDPTLDGPLVPTLFFLAGSTGFHELVDLEYEGDFPTGFTLRVFEPPPVERIGELAPWPGELGTVAWIAAAPPDHVSKIREFAWQGPQGSGCEVGPCELSYEWCVDADQCRVETYSCPTYDDWAGAIDADFTGCTLVGSEGDPDWSVDLYSRVAGFVSGYYLVYLERAAPNGSWVAPYDPLPQGYSLIKSESFTETGVERRLRESCEQQATADALDEFNATHGRDYTLEEISFGCPRGELPDCPETFYDEFSVLVFRTMFDSRCPLQGGSLRVVDPADELLHLRLAPRAPTLPTNP